MTDLWGALEETQPVVSPTLPVAIKAPDDVVIQDLITHEKIRSETNLLKTCLDCSAGIVVAAYKVADYVPNLANDQYRQFWQVQVSLIVFFSNKNTIQYFQILTSIDYF
jgi:hypothetical protein